jgi:DNA repair protein RecO (recombination protein O)
MISLERCIVLQAVKYGDNSLIIRCLCSDGIKSFFIASYLKNKKNQYPFLSFPLSIVECQYLVSAKSKLPKVKSLSLDFVSRHGTYDFRRQAILTFMAECALKYIKEESMNSDLFNFMEESIRFVNDSNYLNAAYPIQFGFGLASLLGFGINNSYNAEQNLNFTISKGFVSDAVNISLSHDESAALYKLTSTPVNENIETDIPSHSLRNIFYVMLQYFRYHFPETSQLKSPEILHLLME